MTYDIILSPQALEHLSALTARHRRIVLDALEVQLVHEPALVTQQRKSLRPNPLASWELRVGQFRVYYQIETDDGAHKVVYIIAVGKKIRNRVIIGGTEVKL